MDTKTHLRVPHYILAGGQSRRFGSNKARYQIDGREMILRVADAFGCLVSSTTVVSQHAGEYADLGLPTIADQFPDAGPLAGLEAALQHATASASCSRSEAREGQATPAWILLSSCDLVAPLATMLTPLLAMMGPSRQAVVYRRGKFFEPFPGLYRVDLSETVQHALQSGRGSFRYFFDQIGGSLAVCEYSERSVPLDLDTPPGPESITAGEVD